MLDRILKEYPTQVRLVFKDFPLDFHALARPAHEAARCAGEAGKYWEYHDRLFAAQPEFARDDLIRYAAELGIPREGFVQCLESGRFRALIEADVEEGRRIGIRGTPTFFINGRPLAGAAPYEAFQELIEEALRR
ncbi:MAG: thioredoxin domain-containing protein [Candidatus Rokubacteria bacterium]|nr:thioredoxin domain-containing protein [Candidatus Rokubacteria bacterium]